MTTDLPNDDNSRISASRICKAGHRHSIFAAVNKIYTYEKNVSASKMCV